MSESRDALMSTLEQLHSVTGAVLYSEVRPQNLANDLSQLLDLLREALPQAEKLAEEIRASW